MSKKEEANQPINPPIEDGENVVQSNEQPNNKPRNIPLGELKTNKRFLETETQNDILKPVIVRIRKRCKDIKELSGAKHEKIMRGGANQIFTDNPQMHIIGPTPKLSNDSYGTITYRVYKSDKNGNKIIHREYKEKDGKKILVSASPIVEKLVVETFEYMKQATIEEFPEGEPLKR